MFVFCFIISVNCDITASSSKMGEADGNGGVDRKARFERGNS
jgi:hypothetical protein